MVSLLRAALESTTEGLLVADLTGRVSAYNRKLLTVLGIPEYVLAPMALDRVLQFLADQFHGPRPLFEAMRELGPKGTRTTFNLDGDEGERLIEASCQPQKIGPRTVGHVFAFRDVTSWEQAVNRLEKRIAELEAQLALADPHRERP
jgi:PAS domain-containing protein